MSATDPLSDNDLRALAQKSRTTKLDPNDQFELDRAIKQHSALSRELKRIISGD